MSNESITIVFDPAGNRQELAPALAQGGEGVVFPLKSRTDVLVKCYHPEVLRKRAQSLDAKVRVMVDMKEQFRGSLCWPSVRVFDQAGNWRGYAMRRASGVSMFKLAHAMLYQKHFPGLDRRHVASYLLDLLSRIEMLHARGVMVGDYNLQNLLCVPGTSVVELIDCDSYQVRTGGQLFRCPVGSPDMTAPEQQNQSFDRIDRTLESERFSVAIVLFKCLMLGRHPYDMVGGDNPVANICKGHFPYGQGSHGIPQGPWYNIWSHMPFRLKSLFIRAFADGAHTPSMRPSLREWAEALQIYRSEMDKGWHELNMKPASPKAKQYRGSQSVG